MSGSNSSDALDAGVPSGVQPLGLTVHSLPVAEDALAAQRTRQGRDRREGHGRQALRDVLRGGDRLQPRRERGMRDGPGIRARVQAQLRRLRAHEIAALGAT